MRQKHHEEVDLYIYELFNLTRQVFPRETVEEAVRTCRDGLLPEIRSSLGVNRYNSPEGYLKEKKIIDLESRIEK